MEMVLDRSPASSLVTRLDLLRHTLRPTPHVPLAMKGMNLFAKLEYVNPVGSIKDRAAYCDLTGVSAEVIAGCNGQHFREKMLITHRGLSGPAILQISSYWNKSRSIEIDLAPGKDLTATFGDSKVPRTLATLRSEFRKALPQRFADRWLEEHAPASWTSSALADLERQAHAWTMHPAGTEGFEKAEVTCGGIDTDELSAKTMESRKVPELYFIGEVVDVTGHLGGFNFQWAWASGFSAGQAV